ncbi:hypothetical protein [Bremerella alba]|nr:hypothetical protein [Bremerella alba]
MTKMRKRRGPEQTIKALQDGEAILVASKSLAEACQPLSISEATWMRWKKEVGGMKHNQEMASAKCDTAQIFRHTRQKLKISRDYHYFVSS